MDLRNIPTICNLWETQFAYNNIGRSKVKKKLFKDTSCRHLSGVNWSSYIYMPDDIDTRAREIARDREGNYTIIEASIY